jgi:hypothetical protein
MEFYVEKIPFNAGRSRPECSRGTRGPAAAGPGRPRSGRLGARHGAAATPQLRCGDPQSGDDE